MNKSTRRHRSLLFQLLLFFGISYPIVMQANETPVVSASLIPFASEIQPGEPFDLAVVFKMTDGWHTYWKNAGEAGMPTTFDWDLPTGFQVVNEQEPVPQRHVEDGITTFIHDEEAIFLFTIQAPQEIPDTCNFSVDVAWLECKSICRAGSAQLELSLPVSPMEVGKQRLLVRAKTHFPQVTERFAGQVSQRRNQIVINTGVFTKAGSKIIDADFFPATELVYDISQKPILRSRFGSQKILIPLLEDLEDTPKQLHGVLKVLTLSDHGQVSSMLLLNETIN